MSNFSTGAINYVMGTGSFKVAAQNGVIALFAGGLPASADAQITATLLGYVTKDGLPFVAGSPTNGLNLDNPVSRVISKVPTDNWIFVPVANGTIGWFMYMGNAPDNLLASTTLFRFQGTCGLGSGDLQMSSLNSRIGTNIVISSCDIGGN